VAPSSSRLATALALALAAGATAEAAATDAPVSLAHFNTPDALAAHEERIADGRPLFMAIKERDGLHTEALAIRILLGDESVGIACERLRDRIRERGNDPAGRRAAHQEVATEIQAMAAAEDFADRYLWYRGEGGKVDPDFLIYTTPLEWVARMYGEVVFEIHEDVPRGVDLNRLNRERYEYYRTLTLREYLDPKGLAIRNVFDREEYVLPSHVPGHQVGAVTIRARLPRWLPQKMVRLTGRRRRRYERVHQGDRSWVDLRDRRGALLARLATNPEVPAPDATEPRSQQELEPELVGRLGRMRIGDRPVRVLR
jgi:hypothetical protein